MTTPAASECLSPEHAGLYGGFKNRCDFAVQYTWCVVDPGPDEFSSTFACVPGRKTNALSSVQAKETSADHTKGGKGVQWFACAYKRETATGPGPDGIWGPVVYELGIGLRGRCALRQYADPTTAQPIVPPVQLQQPVTAASSQAELAIMLNERKQWSDRNPNHLENSKITFEESMQYVLLFLSEDLRILQTHRARLTKAAYDQARNNILANMDRFTKTCRAVSNTPASCVGKYPAAWRSLPPPVRRAPQMVQAAPPPAQPARQAAQVVPQGRPAPATSGAMSITKMIAAHPPLGLDRPNSRLVLNRFGYPANDIFERELINRCSYYFEAYMRDDLYEDEFTSQYGPGVNEYQHGADFVLKMKAGKLSGYLIETSAQLRQNFFLHIETIDDLEKRTSSGGRHPTLGMRISDQTAVSYVVACLTLEAANIRGFGKIGEMPK